MAAMPSRFQLRGRPAISRRARTKGDVPDDQTQSGLAPVSVTDSDREHGLRVWLHRTGDPILQRRICFNCGALMRFVNGKYKCPSRTSGRILYKTACPVDGNPPNLAVAVTPTIYRWPDRKKPQIGNTRVSSLKES